jgi:site-specific recombinase XerD
MLQPLFDTYRNFVRLNYSDLSEELPVVIEFLHSFDARLRLVDGYQAVREFLRSYAGNEATFNSYRTHVERLLLWALLIAEKPLLDLRRSDAEAFLEFCLRPDPDWVGSVVKSRFVRLGGRKKLESDRFVVNEAWRPFSLTQPKAMRKMADEQNQELADVGAYKMSQGSVGQVFAVCTSFYQFCIDEDLTDANPFRAVKQKSRYKQRYVADAASRSLTHLQWDYVIETAERMAAEDPDRYERSLFILITLFAMYLRISDLVGRDNWQPTMGSFAKTGESWWFHVVGKGNKRAKVSVRDDYLPYLKRYRTFLGMPPLPYPGDISPLLASIDGRPGLSDRHIRSLVQEIFDHAAARMRSEGRPDDEVANLRAASLHWLRHTSATFDAPYREMKDLQADLRHESLKTTQDHYYDSLDDERSLSVKEIPLKGR